MLSQKQVPHRERDLFKEPLSIEELRALLRGRPASEIFATRSPTFKKLGLVDRELTDDERLRLMSEHPPLIRRPIVAVGDRLIIGFDAKALEAALPG
ncbi:MAG: transcriptional regulator [Chloroflexi bacterium]|nr:transcriptional regulator [Chloroflexota bacterium]